MQLGACSKVLNFLALGSENCSLLSVEFQKSSQLISLCPADELCTGGSLVLYALRHHLRAQFSWLIDSMSCLGWVCGIVVMPGNFLEQDSVCRTGGTAIIHPVTAAQGCKENRFSCLGSRETGCCYLGISSGSWTLSEAIQAGGSLLETHNIPIFIYLCACKNCDRRGQFIAVVWSRTAFLHP